MKKIRCWVPLGSGYATKQQQEIADHKREQQRGDIDNCLLKNKIQYREKIVSLRVNRNKVYAGKSIGRFCGSKSGNNPLYEAQATELGHLLAEKNITLIYGGGKKGIMGSRIQCSPCEERPGHRHHSVDLKDREVHHEGITELIIVETCISGKRCCIRKCDAAIILPGASAPMDEFFEMVTWNQLSIHDKKIFILNTAGFFTITRSRLPVRCNRRVFCTTGSKTACGGKWNPLRHYSNILDEPYHRFRFPWNKGICKPARKMGNALILPLAVFHVGRVSVPIIKHQGDIVIQVADPFAAAGVSLHPAKARCGYACFSVGLPLS